MRGRSFHRPKEKLRGVKRRLAAFDKWANSFEGYFPSEHSNEKYWNCKIPMLDRMVNRPTTTKEIQTHCAKAMLRAVAFIEKGKPKILKSSIVTVLLTCPDMYGSEICVFFDEEYYNGFFKRNDEDQIVTAISNRSLLQELGVEPLKGFKEYGFHCLNKETRKLNFQNIKKNGGPIVPISCKSLHFVFQALSGNTRAKSQSGGRGESTCGHPRHS